MSDGSPSGPWRFFALTAGLAFGLGLPGAAATHGLLPGRLALPLLLGALLSPGAAALWLRQREAGPAGVRALLSSFTAWRVHPGWYVVAVALPFGVNAGALGLLAALGGEVPAVPGTLAPEQRAAPWLLPLVFLVPSAMEELGWRGHALPRLQSRCTALTASLLIGAVWAVWHVPLRLVADSTQGEIPFGWYAVNTLALSIVFTWLANSTSGRLLPVTVLHASVQISTVVLPVLPNATGDADAYRLSVAMTALVAAVLLLAFGPRRLARRPGPKAGGIHVRTREGTAGGPARQRARPVLGRSDSHATWARSAGAHPRAGPSSRLAGGYPHAPDGYGVGAEPTRSAALIWEEPS